MADTHTKIDCVRWEDGEVYDINLPRTATPHITALGVDEQILTGDAGLPESGYTIINNGTVKVKPASTETKPQLDLLSANQNSTAKISAEVKSKNADGYIVSDNSTLTLKSLGVVRGGDAVYNTFTISADYDGTQHIGDFLVNNISRGGLQFLHGFKATQNVIFNKDIKVDGSIICKELKLHPLATEPLKLPSIWVGGDVDAANNTITAKTVECDTINPAGLGVNYVTIPSCQIQSCVITSDITTGIIRYEEDESGHRLPIEIENPINISHGGTNSFVGDIECEAVTSRKACMTTAVGADKTAFKQNDIVTLTYNNKSKSYVISSVANIAVGEDGFDGDISTGADPLTQGLIKGLFNGFVALEISYIDSSNSNIYTYQLPGISYFNEHEEKTIQIPLPHINPNSSVPDSIVSTYINEGKLVFYFAKTSDKVTTPELFVSRTLTSANGTGLYTKCKIKFWHNNDFIDVPKISIRLRKFN